MRPSFSRTYDRITSGLPNLPYTKNPPFQGLIRHNLGVLAGPSATMPSAGRLRRGSQAAQAHTFAALKLDPAALGPSGPEGEKKTPAWSKPEVGGFQATEAPRSGARAPGAQQEEQVLHANVAGVVEICETISLLGARPPGAQQEEQILHANVTAVIKVSEAHDRRRD